MSFLRTSRKQPGWMAMHLDASEMVLIHGLADAKEGAKPEILQVMSRPLYADQRTSIAKLSKELDLKRFQRTTVLRPSEYQMLLIEAPKVGSEEVVWAVRWHNAPPLEQPVSIRRKS